MGKDERMGAEVEVEAKECVENSDGYSMNAGTVAAKIATVRWSLCPDGMTVMRRGFKR